MDSRSAPPRFFPEELPSRSSGFWSDLFDDRALLVLLAAALTLNFVLAAYLLLRFDSLPELLPLHFDTAGFPDRVDSKIGIFALPIIGFIVLLANACLAVLAHMRERAASKTLAAGALLLQFLMWFGAGNIIGGLF